MEGRKGALDDVNELETCKKETVESLSLTHTHSPSSSSFSSSLENGEITKLLLPMQTDALISLIAETFAVFIIPLLFHKVSCDDAICQLIPTLK